MKIAQSNNISVNIPPTVVQKKIYSDSYVSLLKNNYVFITDELSNEQRTVGFVLFYELLDFLLWVHAPIVAVFGDVKKTLHLYKGWDEDNYHLVLSVFSELDDMDKLTQLENLLFTRLDEYPALDHALQYIVIAQR